MSVTISTDPRERAREGERAGEENRESQIQKVREGKEGMRVLECWWCKQCHPVLAALQIDGGDLFVLFYNLGCCPHFTCPPLSQSPSTLVRSLSLAPSATVSFVTLFVLFHGTAASVLQHCFIFS